MSIAAAPRAAMPSSGPSFESEIWLDAVRKRALQRARTPPPRLPRSVLYTAALVGVLAHVALFIGLYFAMKPDKVVEADVMHVELFDALPAEPALPEPLPKPALVASTLPPVSAPPSVPRNAAISAPTSTRAVSAVAQSASPQATAQASTAASEYRPYNADGSLNIPKDLIEQIDAAKPQPNFIAQSTAPSPIMGPHRPLKIRPNYFAKSWVHARNENLLSAILSKLNDITEQAALSHEFRTPSGDKVVCSWILIIAGCSWGYPPPPGGHPTEPWKPATVLDEY